MPHRPFSGMCCLALTLLAACESYDFKVNDKVVYSPHPLLQDFETPDPALRGCLEQAIVDGAVRTFEQLTSLNCSHAGIEDVDGLSRFTRINTLKLSSNNVRNLVEIASISSLEELHLDNNQVIDPVPLYQLSNLRFIDLSDNANLQCPTRGAFAQVETVILPRHCQ